VRGRLNGVKTRVSAHDSTAGTENYCWLLTADTRPRCARRRAHRTPTMWLKIETLWHHPRRTQPPSHLYHLLVYYFAPITLQWRNQRGHVPLR